MIRHFNWGTAGVFFLWLISMGLVASTVDKNFPRLVICLVIFVVFSAWGHVIVFPLHYKKRGFLNGFIWGTISGIAIGSLITSVIVYAIGWNLLAIFGAVTVLPLVLFGFLWRRKCRNNDSVHNRDPDIRILFATLLIVTLFFYLPFKNLGALVDGKYLYAWLFGHDFINRMVHVNSLSQGLPLSGFFFAGEKLSYYWLAYVFPALLSNINWMQLETQQILQLTQLFYSLITTVALVLFLSGFTTHKRHLGMLIVISFLFYSYGYLYKILIAIWNELAGGLQLKLIGYDLSIFSGFSHTFYRFFLVELQGTLAIAVMAMILMLYEEEKSWYHCVLIGLLLGLLFGIEATNGIMFALWFISIGTFNTLRGIGKRYCTAKMHLVSMIVAGFVYGILFLIEMYSFQTGRGVLQIKPNWFAILSTPLYFPFAYGPMCLLGAGGLIVFLKRKERSDSSGYSYIILLGIALFFVFFITNPTEIHFGLLKATRIIPLSFLVFSAYVLRKASHIRMVKHLILGSILLAIPSVFIDNRIASDISNPSTYVRHTDMEAVKWIRTNLPPQAIVQAEPNYPLDREKCPPKYSYSLIPVFAERRTAIGEWKVSAQEHGKAEEVGTRFHSIRRMFATGDLRECNQILNAYGIEYIYVGELEKMLYPEGIKKFYENKDCFEKIYFKDNVDIFRFNSCS